jgi:hypothetical protein
MGESSKSSCNEHTKLPDVNPLHAAQPEPSPTLDREYEFFVTTEEPHQPEGVERGKIRRLVMRNFFETKAAGPQTNASEHSSASTVMAKKQLKNRFRLPKSGEDLNDPGSKRREGKIEEGKGKGKRPQGSRKTSGASERSTLTNEGRSTRGSPAKPKNGGTEHLASDPEPTDRGLILKIEPSAHRFDPFDVLPVPGTQQLDTLFKLCKSSDPSFRFDSHVRHEYLDLIFDT